MPGFSSQPEQLKYDMRDTSITPDKYCMNCFRAYDEKPYDIMRPRIKGVAAVVMGPVLPEKSEEVCFRCAARLSDRLYSELPLEEVIVGEEDRRRFIWRAQRVDWLQKNAPWLDPWNIPPGELNVTIERVKTEGEQGK